MDYYALDQMITEDKQKGNKPFFVNAMSGSTVMGSYDNHNKVADICQKHGLWHHIDACWGGFLSWSDKSKYLFDGSERSNSACINAHKG